jgi:predicted membrane channel-forming protein YqfA (hemolysin III family)
VTCWICTTVAPFVTVAVAEAVVYTVLVVVPTLAGVVVLKKVSTSFSLRDRKHLHGCISNRG